MAVNPTNLIVGAAAVYLSASDSTVSGWNGGPAIPAFPTTNNSGFADALEASSNWRNVGFTADGLEISYEPTYTDITVDQLMDAARVFKSGQRVTIGTTLSEATLTNLLVAWGLPASQLVAGGASVNGFDGAALATGSEEIGIPAGALGDRPVERALAFVGPAPDAADGKKRERVYHIRRALSVDTTAHSVRRADPTAFPVSFRVLPDPTRSNAEYGTIRDRVIPGS